MNKRFKSQDNIQNYCNEKNNQNLINNQLRSLISSSKTGSGSGSKKISFHSSQNNLSAHNALALQQNENNSINKQQYQTHNQSLLSASTKASQKRSLNSSKSFQKTQIKIERNNSEENIISKSIKELNQNSSNNKLRPQSGIQPYFASALASPQQLQKRFSKQQIQFQLQKQGQMNKIKSNSFHQQLLNAKAGSIIEEAKDKLFDVKIPLQFTQEELNYKQTQQQQIQEKKINESKEYQEFKQQMEKKMVIRDSNGNIEIGYERPKLKPFDYEEQIMLNKDQELIKNNIKQREWQFKPHNMQNQNFNNFMDSSGGAVTGSQRTFLTSNLSPRIKGNINKKVRIVLNNEEEGSGEQKEQQNTNNTISVKEQKKIQLQKERIYFEKQSQEWKNINQQIRQQEDKIADLKQQQTQIIHNLQLETTQKFNEQKNSDNSLHLEKLQFLEHTSKFQERRDVEPFSFMNDKLSKQKQKVMKSLEEYYQNQSIQKIKQKVESEIDYYLTTAAQEIERSEKMCANLESQIQKFKLEKMETQIQTEQMQQQVIQKNMTIQQLEQENIDLRDENLKTRSFRQLYLKLENKFPEIDIEKLVDNYLHLQNQIIQDQQDLGELEEQKKVQGEKFANNFALQSTENERMRVLVVNLQKQLKILQDREDQNTRILNKDYQQYKEDYFQLFNKSIEVFNDWRENLSPFELKQFQTADSLIVSDWDKSFNKFFGIKMNQSVNKKILSSQLQDTQQQQRFQQIINPIDILTMMQKYVKINTNEKSSQYLRQLVAQINLIARKNFIENQAHVFEPESTLIKIENYIISLQDQVKQLKETHQKLKANKVF